MEQLRVSFPFAWCGKVGWQWDSRFKGREERPSKGKHPLKRKRKQIKILWSQNVSPLLISSAPVTPTTGHVLDFHQQWHTKSVPITALGPGGEQWLFQSCLSWERTRQWRSWVQVQSFMIAIRGMRGNETALFYFLRFLNHGFKCVALIMVLLDRKPRIRTH